jgi:hypothetical protein
MATLNIGLKVNRAITGATTVNANATAIVTYLSGVHNVINTLGVSTRLEPAPPQGRVVVRVFGPGQSVPASFTGSFKYDNDTTAFATGTVTYSLLSGVELINTQ